MILMSLLTVKYCYLLIYYQYILNNSWKTIKYYLLYLIKYLSGLTWSNIFFCIKLFYSKVELMERVILITSRENIFNIFTAFLMETIFQNCSWIAKYRTSALLLRFVLLIYSFSFYLLFIKYQRPAEIKQMIKIFSRYISRYRHQICPLRSRDQNNINIVHIVTYNVALF